MKLSIIIPVYNVEKYISRCLDSLLVQDLNNNDYEIIVVNDGSIDNSMSIVLEYAKNYDLIKIVNQNNRGVGSARNNGIDNATGKYVYFIDPDDYLVSNCLKQMVEIAESNNLDILTFLSKSFFPKPASDKLVSKKLNAEVMFKEIELSTITSGIEYVANRKYKSEVWWFFINREFLVKSKIRFIVGRWMEDAIFSTEILLKAKRIAHLKLEIHNYMVAPGTAMTSMKPSHYLKIIRDNQNAAIVFDSIIKKMKNKNVNPDCLKRLKARQQSFVFFLMIRILKSTMRFSEVKLIINEMSEIKAFPLDSFLGRDYNVLSYQILTRLFNNKRRFYFLFFIFNPLFKLRYKFSNPI